MWLQTLRLCTKVPSLWATFSITRIVTTTQIVCEAKRLSSTCAVPLVSQSLWHGESCFSFLPFPFDFPPAVLAPPVHGALVVYGAGL